ncbi:hypothetical protein AM587_10005895 [Phytophthora nicotianae]|nr:hypothetical protein AM588_10002315 [Phytophthora nicotianae]KUF89762.1 hypothetical protein AM587_10005895 [Phytophthora nicotianae]
MLWLLYVNNYRAKRGGESWFSDNKLFDLLRKVRSEEELVILFQSLRKYPAIKNLADEMQAYMILSSASSHKLVNEAWLKSRESPLHVFESMRLGDETLESFASSPLFIQWLRYIKVYKVVVESESFSDLETLKFLIKAKPFVIEAEFGTLFQSIKNIPDLESFAKNLQTHLYQKWMNDNKLSPKELASLLGIPYSIDFTRLPKSDPMYRNLEAYTVYVAERQGGKAMLTTVEKLFADNDVYAALAAVSKA